jgi:NAD(P)-dependent dehydrogenase (short-subunit alcohol dehydrogenase family)
MQNISPNFKRERMKVLIVGASGTIGKIVDRSLLPRHEIIRASKINSNLHIDLSSEQSIQELFFRTGKIDAIVSVAGNVHFGPLKEMSAAQFNIGLQSKLLGQINLALIGQQYLNDGGSITLTSGIASHDPVQCGSNITVVNAAIDAFVVGAAIELERGVRINSVSPSVLQASWDVYGPFFAGFEPVSSDRVALAYIKSIEGRQTGQTYRVW